MANCRYFFHRLSRQSFWTNFDAMFANWCRMNQKFTCILKISILKSHADTSHWIWGNTKSIINKVFVGTVSKRGWQWSCYVTITYDKITKLILVMHRRRQGTDVGRWNVSNAYRFDTLFWIPGSAYYRKKMYKKSVPRAQGLLSRGFLESY